MNNKVQKYSPDFENEYKHFVENHFESMFFQSGSYVKLLSELRDGYVLNESRVTSIFPKINEKIQEQLLKIHSDFLENQIMALENALKQKDEWNANPEALWKSINEHSISWCKAFSMPLKR